LNEKNIFEDRLKRGSAVSQAASKSGQGFDGRRKSLKSLQKRRYLFTAL